ncbi:uncharacterized protein BDZ83DRAFT_651573 [Colletotrichum acutatum]|uniref:Uncharacterized protein n=1 Tax=Glomerella acutata TaxID=27357 RepID=A0AAD8XIX5_GLOAC|nr:uncharacterized protein BDZ83DRAFT_651573 [Colletotrichum acutatum]KAK1725190.1 hypothetical protein BDZ83DRAFT_651573 [Colletotrichum acutatum]
MSGDNEDSESPMSCAIAPKNPRLKVNKPDLLQCFCGAACHSSALRCWDTPKSLEMSPRRQCSLLLPVRDNVYRQPAPWAGSGQYGSCIVTCSRAYENSKKYEGVTTINDSLMSRD